MGSRRERELDLSTVKGRLLHLLRAKRMSQAEFTREMEVSPTYIGAMRKSMPEEKVMRLCGIFPDLNRDWLLYGEGEMLRPEGNCRDDTSGNGRDRSRPYMRQVSEEDEGDGSGGIGRDRSRLYMSQRMRRVSEGAYEVPLLPVEAFAGRLQDWALSVDMRQCETLLCPLKGVDFAIRISGDSMEPNFHDGATLFIKRINERAFIPWGHVMVIDTENGVLVKLVYPGDPESPEDAGTASTGGVGARAPKHIEARSYNPNYPPIRIPTASIYGLYRVMGALQVFPTF